MRDQRPPTPPRFRSFRQTGPGWLWGWPAGVKPRGRPQSTSSSTPAVFLLPPLRGMGGHLWSLKPRGIPLAGPCSWTISSTGECWSCPRAGARGLRAAGGEPPSQPFNKDLRPCSDSASPCLLLPGCAWEMRTESQDSGLTGWICIPPPGRAE